MLIFDEDDPVDDSFGNVPPPEARLANVVEPC